MKKILVAGIAILGAALLIPQIALAQGNLVFNGGFDTDASGWQATDIGGNGGYMTEKGDPGGFFFLNNTPSLAVYPTISQTISGLIPNSIYLVSGNYAYSEPYGSGSSTDASFGVALNNSFLFEAALPADTDWQSFSFLYTASSSSAVLSLSSQINGTDISYLIDNISMVAAPEPGVLGLFALGGLVLGFRHRKARAV